MPRCFPTSSSARSLSQSSTRTSSEISPSASRLIRRIQRTAARSSGLASGFRRPSSPIRSAALQKAIFPSSDSTLSAFTPQRAERAAMARSILALTAGLSRFSAPLFAAEAGEYPARTAAADAFRSNRYSSQNRFCFPVIVFPLSVFPFFNIRTAAAPQRRMIYAPHRSRGA